MNNLKINAMNYIRKLETKDLESLKENSVIVLNEFIRKNFLKQINLEIKSWLNKGCVAQW